MNNCFPSNIVNIQNQDGIIYNHVYSASTSHTGEFELDKHGEDTTNTSVTDDETISIP